MSPTPPKPQQPAFFRMIMAAILGVGVAYLLASSAIELQSGVVWIAFAVWVVVFPIVFAIAWRREKKRGNLERADRRP